MPIYQATPIKFEAPTEAALKETRSEYRKSRMTRFVTDENIEPWALHVMRYKKFDVIDCDSAKIRHRDDGTVFRRAWHLKRVLVTHDHDFLDDRLFPFSGCSGLLVLPTYGRVSLEFGNLLAEAVAMIGRGREMWFHTKIVATRSFALKVRTWEKSEGRVVAWDFQLPSVRG